MNVPAGYFAAQYRTGADPWSLATRWYERRKYALTIAALPKERYRRAFEPGCSVGVLSARLAACCDELVSWDREQAAVTAARDRLGDAAHARVEQRAIPGDWPDADFDLIVLSEILYYFDPVTVAAVLVRTAATLEPGGTLIAVHWRHPVAEHAQSGQAVHEAVRRLPGFAGLARHEEPDFLLDVLVRADPGDQADQAPYSVAAAEGLV